MSRISAKELCQRIKSEATWRQNDREVNDLRIRILDYFIALDPPGNSFEGLLKARINDPDPAKEASKIICAEILKAWQTKHDDKGER